jgi:cell division cycle protein 37
MARAFDYSKWDNIELSDDESDLHPNIDKDSWFRLKHRTRLEREEREDAEIQEFNERNKQDQARINIIQARLKAASGANSCDDDNDAQYEDLDALQIELNELRGQIEQRNKRAAEYQERRKWNIDNICKVKEEKTIVNEVKAKSLKSEIPLVDEDGNVLTPVTSAIPTAAPPLQSSSNPKPVPTASTASASATTSKGMEPSATIKRERMAVISYNDFAINHERILETFSEIQDLEATKEYLFKHCDILMHEHAQSYMLLSCLEDEMNGKHKRMKLVGRQSQILSHIHELGTSMRRDPRDVILPFFKRIQEPDYLQGFLAAVDDFIAKIQKRAVEKRKEMDAERAQQGEEEYYDEENVPLGPGGLNPLEVLRNLPESMRTAFESQDMDRLQQVLARMDPVEAKYWMRQCVDSGLWVSKDPTIFDDAPDAALPAPASSNGDEELDEDEDDDVDDVAPKSSEDA